MLSLLRSLLIVCCIAAAAIWANCPPLVHALQDRLSVARLATIELKSEVVIDRDIVLIGDVAKVTCSTDHVRKKIEQIEVCEFDEKTKERTISHINIRSRLVLSGVTLDHVRLFGNKECLVSFGISNHVTDQEIEVEAHRLLCDEMGADPRDLSVNLQSALMATMPPKIQDMNDVQVKVVPPSRINLGSLNMGVQFWHDDKILVTRFAVFSVRKRHRVAIAKASLSKAVPLGEQSIDFEERFLATPADELTFEQISGRSVKSVVQAGAIIQLKDLQSSETGKAVVIRKGDNVKVAAVIGSLRVEMANAEAVQDGGLGDFINLKNRETGKTIVGEVKARGRVLIEL